MKQSQDQFADIFGTNRGLTDLAVAPAPLSKNWSLQYCNIMTWQSDEKKRRGGWTIKNRQVKIHLCIYADRITMRFQSHKDEESISKVYTALYEDDELIRALRMPKENSPTEALFGEGRSSLRIASEPGQEVILFWELFGVDDLRERYICFSQNSLNDIIHAIQNATSDTTSPIKSFTCQKPF